MISMATPAYAHARHEERDGWDRLVEQMSSFLLAGRAWTVDWVSHEDRIVTVRDAPAGVKPSWLSRTIR